MGAIFRGADVLALTAIALVAAPLAAGRMAPSSLAPFAIGAFILVWSLSALHAYAFTQREDLIRHLVRLSAGFGLAALALQLLLMGFRPAVVAPEPFGLWFLASFAALATLHVGWWLLVRRWRAMGRLTPNIVVVGATANAEALIKAALGSREAAVLGMFDDRADRIPSHIAGVPVLGDTAALVAHRIMPYARQDRRSPCRRTPRRGCGS